MSKKLVLLIIFCGTLAFAQEKSRFGVLTQSEKEFKQFEKDTTANAVYLYEKGDIFFEVRNGYVRLITKYHAKIKILNKEGFDHGTIEIPYYHTERSTEKVNEIRGFVYNKGRIIGIDKSQIFKVDQTERWSSKTFTFPNIEVGSILEYSYERESPFFFNLTGWEFQADIPKVYSEFNAKIPGNYIYNRSLIGELPLSVNEATIEKNCFTIPTANEAASCEVLTYSMEDIPAFYEDEKYMLSGDNYKSRLAFELSEQLKFDGQKIKFTKTWKDVDREFRLDKDIGRQLRKKNFFEKQVPAEILVGTDELEKAKKIFAYVRDHYTWNKKYGLWRDNSVKQAFGERKGSVAEINITLINLLNAAGIKSNLMLLATRKAGLPKKVYPVMSDFNYVIAKTEINGESYLLDATDKKIPFGILPFRCLNYYGRVMDFDKESYWYDIVPEANNKKSTRAQMTLDVENGKVYGMFETSSSGYESVAQRKKIASLSEDEYLNSFEEALGDDFNITSYALKDKTSNDKRIVQRFEYEIEDVVEGNLLYFDPFLVKFFDTNPFLMEERHYPIDFGYLRNYEFSINIKIPEGYRVKDLPKKVNLALPEESGHLYFDCTENIGSVNVVYRLKLSATQYKSKAYDIVKTLFVKAVEIQNQSLIFLERN